MSCHVEPNSWLVFPSSDATELNNIAPESIKQLIYIDGSWRKAKRLLLEYPILKTLPKIKLTPSHTSRYRIRQSRIPGSLSTLESITQTLSTLENDEDKYQPLLDSMDWLIEKQIELMGKNIFEKNYSNPR